MIRTRLYHKLVTLTALTLFSVFAATAQDPNPNDEEIAMAKRFIDAEKERHLGNYEEALRLFDLCLTIDPENDAAHFGVGKVYLEQEKYGLSEAAFAKAYELDGDNKWYALSYAQVLLDQLKFKEASKIYKDVVDQHPEDTELKLDYANTLLFAGKEKAALKVFDEIEEITGPTHDIARRKYEYFITRRKYDEAGQELQKLLSVYPEDTQLYGMLAELYKAQGLVKEALEVYQEAIKSDPMNPIFQLSLAEYYDRIGETDTAMVYLVRAFENPNLEIDRKVSVLLRMYNEAERDLDTRVKVMRLCEAVVETHPTEAKAHSIYGDFLNLAGDKEGALEEFLIAVGHDPSKFAIWSQILLIESELNMIEELVMDSKKAMDLFPAQPTVYFFNGMANSQLGIYEDAVKSLRIGAQMVIGNNALAAQMLASLGDAYQEIGRSTSSDSAYEAALIYDPNNAYVLNNYSYFLSLRGEKLELAKEMSERSLNLDPNNASYLDTYGWILYKLNDLEGAEEYLRRSIDRGGDRSAEVMEHLGDVLYKRGDQQAKEFWQRALELEPDNPALMEKIDEAGAEQ